VPGPQTSRAQLIGMKAHARGIPLSGYPMHRREPAMALVVRLVCRRVPLHEHATKALGEGVSAALAPPMATAEAKVAPGRWPGFQGRFFGHCMAPDGVQFVGVCGDLPKPAINA